MEATSNKTNQMFSKYMNPAVSGQRLITSYNPTKSDTFSNQAQTASITVDNQLKILYNLQLR